MTPGATTVEGDWLRYVVRDDELVALLVPGAPVATLAEVVDAGGASARLLGGGSVAVSTTASGLAIELAIELGIPGSSDPVAVVLSGVAPAASLS